MLVYYVRFLFVTAGFSQFLVETMESCDETIPMDTQDAVGTDEEAVDEESSSMDDIRKNLLSDLSDDSPSKSATDDESMPPPPMPRFSDSSEKMKVFLRIRPLTEEEKNNGDTQVSFDLRRVVELYR